MADRPELCSVTVDGLLLASLKSIASRHGMTVRSSTVLAPESLREARFPSCVILDLDLAEATWPDQLCDARTARRPVVAVATQPTVRTVVGAMRAGAFTVLEKPHPGHSIDLELDEAIAGALAAQARENAKHAARDRAREHLTRLSAEEQQILHGVVTGKLNKEIATELQLSLRTIESRRTLIKQKLQVDSLVELLRVLAIADWRFPA